VFLGLYVADAIPSFWKNSSVYLTTFMLYYMFTGQGLGMAMHDKASEALPRVAWCMRPSFQRPVTSEVYHVALKISHADLLNIHML
jgi:hypothetical protein